MSGRSDVKARMIADSVRTCGWMRTLFAVSTKGDAINEELLDDVRRTDGLFLAASPGQDLALVVDCRGVGELALALSRLSKRVIAVEASCEDTAVVAARAAETGGCVYALVGSPEHLPIPSATVSSVVYSARPANHHRIEAHLCEFARVLRPGGSLYLIGGNTYGVARFLTGTGEPYQRATLRWWCTAIRRCGFAEIEPYAPLPSHMAAPIAILPVRCRPARAFVLARLSGILETISPELKSAHRNKLRVARLVMQGACKLHLSALITAMLPGYHIIARRM